MFDGVIIETVARIIKTFHIHLYFSMKKKPPAITLAVALEHFAQQGANKINIFVRDRLVILVEIFMFTW